MKRSQDPVHSPPQPKRPKVDGDSSTEAEWTRVERRKAKKSRKMEAKHDVRLSSHPFALLESFSVQTQTPRFMYVNGEIVRRKDAVHVDVSLLVYFSRRKGTNPCSPRVFLGHQRFDIAHHCRRTTTQLGQDRGVLLASCPVFLHFTDAVLVAFAVNPTGCRPVDTRNLAILPLDPPAPNVSHCQPKHSALHSSLV